MKKTGLFISAILLILLLNYNPAIAQNLPFNQNLPIGTKHICTNKKYELCCTAKKALFKSSRCKNYKCPPPMNGLGLKPAIYLYPNGTGNGAIYRKPAVYLYTKTPLKVNIKLDKSVLISYDAPKYAQNKGWNVLAYPDGKIKDLQPQYTNCKTYDKKKLGLEYAKKACLANNYPYVFWEGKMTKKPIPASKYGWIVKQNDLQSFLNKKLDYIGFNKAEKDEFVRFWVKWLSNEGYNRYFIYFLQTQAVNELAPMQVTPKPTSVNRIYMVAKPVTKKTGSVPAPQKLEKFKRNGFTLVEWGGTIAK